MSAQVARSRRLLPVATVVYVAFTIFTTDGDFSHFAKILPIALYDAIP